MRNKELDSIIDSYKDEMIANLAKLIEFESFTWDKCANIECLNFVLDLARSLGFKTMQTSDSSVGIIEMGKGNECVGILVHVDVVGLGDLKKWESSPFKAKIDNNFVIGRGAADDKGAVVMSLYAMKAISDIGHKLDKRICLIIGTSEESEWHDIDKFKEEFTQPDYGFSPDGEFPIFYAEKGYADVLISFKDENDDILNIVAGDSENTIPSIARIEFKDSVSLEAKGISAHSSTPEYASNAIISLCSYISRNLKKSYSFSDFIVDLLDDDGDSTKLFNKNIDERIISEFGKTTATPTILKKIDDTTQLNINIRNCPGIEKQDIETAINLLSNKYNFTYEIRGYLKPMSTDKNSRFIKIMQEVSRDYNIDDSLEVASGTSYAKSMENFVSWGPIFKDDPQTAHMENERISIKTFLLGTKIYAEFITRL